MHYQKQIFQINHRKDSSTDMKIGSNKDINKYHKKLLMTPREPVGQRILPRNRRANKRLPWGPAGADRQPKNACQKYKDEKLAITILNVGAGLLIIFGRP